MPSLAEPLSLSPNICAEKAAPSVANPVSGKDGYGGIRSMTAASMNIAAGDDSVTFADKLLSGKQY